MLNAFEMHDGCLAPVPRDNLGERLDRALWLDLLAPSDEERRQVEPLYPEMLPTAEEAQEIEASSRFYEDASGLHIHTFFLAEKSGRLRNTTVAFTLGRDRLLSLREQEIPVFRLLLQVLARPAFRLRVEGREHLPADEQVVYVANHASFLDPFVMAAAMGPARVARTRWTGYTGMAFANPVTRFLSRIARTLPVEPERGATAALALSAAAIRQGDSLAWFPEGRRSPDGRLHDFRPGIGRLLARFPLRVIPLHIAGSFAAMPVGRLWPRFTPIVIRIGAPIDPRTLVPDLTAADAPERIAAALREAVARLETPPAPREAGA